jgi:hypothetical protein
MKPQNKIEALGESLEDREISLAAEEGSFPLEEASEHQLPVPVEIDGTERETLLGPDQLSIALQCAATVSLEGTSPQDEAEVTEGAIALYTSFNPRDAYESVAARLTVGLTNCAMASMARAAKQGCTANARELEMRVTIKSASAVTELLKVLEHRGASRQTVTVGQVTVQPGGQAIVGNVGPRPQPSADEPTPTLTVSRSNDEDE